MVASTAGIYRAQKYQAKLKESIAGAKETLNY